jgi:hypothetical protein
VDASDFDEAVEKAQDWLDGGDWGEEEDYVSIKITDADGNEKKVGSSGRIGSGVRIL